MFTPIAASPPNTGAEVFKALASDLRKEGDEIRWREGVRTSGRPQSGRQRHHPKTWIRLSDRASCVRPAIDNAEEKDKWTILPSFEFSSHPLRQCFSVPREGGGSLLCLVRDGKNMLPKTAADAIEWWRMGADSPTRPNTRSRSGRPSERRSIPQIE